MNPPTLAGPFRVIVTPLQRRPGKFIARLINRNTQEDLCVSHQPLLQSARILLAQGADPAALISMRHHNQSIDAMQTTIGIAAQLSVTDPNHGIVKFRQWRSWEEKIDV